MKDRCPPPSIAATLYDGAEFFCEWAHAGVVFTAGNIYHISKKDDTFYLSSDRHGLGVFAGSTNHDFTIMNTTCEEYTFMPMDELDELAQFHVKMTGRLPK